jgi:demethylmenaquinone methyltransferase/2-methoxy-6-polyprenyl-1,4-benzoquinol methylase
MFGRIAPQYDFLNHLLSFSMDRLWRRRTARRFLPILSRSDARVLDLCCGTGDLAFALDRARKKAMPSDASGRMPGMAGAPIVGSDFVQGMLERAHEKSRLHGRNVVFATADAMNLPFSGASFDLVTTAFGFRNLANYRAGLEEFHRVLRPGGQFGILDFGEPGGLLGRLYTFYFRRILPAIGSRISGVSGPYAYLPASVHSFPPPGEMLQEMHDAGFKAVSWKPYSFGIAGLYRGMKP